MKNIEVKWMLNKSNDFGFHFKKLQIIAWTRKQINTWQIKHCGKAGEI